MQAKPRFVSMREAFANRTRITKEAKAKVVADGWGTELFLLNAAPEI